MIDKIQATGSLPNLTWFGSTGGSSGNFPYANHRDSRGITTGGNFLFEDSSVLWRKFNLAAYRTTIDVGSAAANWVVFYRPGDLDKGPW